MNKPAPTLTAEQLLGPEEFADLLGTTAAQEFKPPAVYSPPRGTNPKGGPGRIRRKSPESYPDHPDYVAPPERGRGRPKGSKSVSERKQATKSSVTQQRIALEAGLREYIAHPEQRQILSDALDRILRISAYGLEDKDAVAAARVLFDKLLSSVKQEDDATQREVPTVTIEIVNATVKPGAERPVIEVPFSEVKD